MLVAGGNTFVEWVIVLSSTLPVVGMIWFAWWFLRAGKRYDERERAAGRTAHSRPPRAGSVVGRAADARPEDRAPARPPHPKR